MLASMTQQAGCRRVDVCEGRPPMDVVAVGVCLSAPHVLCCRWTGDVAPYFKTEPGPPEIHLEGNRLVLTCLAEGSWPLEFKWILNNTDITSFTQEYKYTIPSLQRSDRGSYQCVVRNRMGALLQKRAEIQVAYMGSFAEAEQRKTATQGRAAVLNSPVVSCYPRPQVTWFRDGYKIIPSSRVPPEQRCEMEVVWKEEEEEKSLQPREIGGCVDHWLGCLAAQRGERPPSYCHAHRSARSARAQTCHRNRFVPSTTLLMGAALSFVVSVCGERLCAACLQSKDTCQALQQLKETQEGDATVMKMAAHEGKRMAEDGCHLRHFPYGTSTDV
ncbi:hypothetical protein ACEWY4_002557 [Coilia grayii]|uniref:Ig-like domain-containing protein n=1 Tax=Coilia grayii TaxID=363190 RepID=A0ABD1KNQ9_9TELE